MLFFVLMKKLMRKIFSERNLVVFLFLAALVIFSFAQEDARRVERMYYGSGASVSTSIMPSPQKTAGIVSDNSGTAPR
jgi:hypothetical protein